MDKAKVLFLAADPFSADPRRTPEEQQPRLRLDVEMREIMDKIRGTAYRDSLEFIARTAVRTNDLLQALNEVRPQVVHFSGHGTADGEIIVVGDDGAPHPVSRKALLSLFRTMKDDIQVVLLNACYTQRQADGIDQVIDCVIGMSTRISDDAGIAFSAAFYQALGFGRSVRAAFDQGTTALMLKGIPEDGTPRLVPRAGVDPDQIIIVDPELDPRKRIVAVIRDELRDNLGQLASQISHTCLSVPSGDPVPRRPGETREQFEVRDRDWFAREVEYVFSRYQQTALEDAVLASQRTNLVQLDETLRYFIDDAYRGVREVENRLSLYRERLQKGLAGPTYDSGRRATLARLYSRYTANRLSELWFQILQNWVMLQPDETDIDIMRLSLAQVLSEPNELPLLGIPLGLDEMDKLPPLAAGREGWRYAKQERLRLNTEKMELDQEIAHLSATSFTSPADAENQATGFRDALGRATLAYCEGRAENAVVFLEQALRFPEVPEEERHFARTSLAFLRDPDAYDGVLGAYLMEVDEAGPAARAGLRKGDVILRYNGAVVTEPNVLSRLVSQARGAPHVAIEGLRDGERLTVYVRGGASLCAIATALVYVESLAV
jgi:hypothetical protein